MLTTPPIGNNNRLSQWILEYNAEKPQEVNYNLV
jgi:hypothetical protein